MSPLQVSILQETLGRPQAEDLPRLRRCGRAAAEARAAIDDLLHQLCVARRQPVGLDAQVVLEAGADMAAGFQAPLVDFPLMTSDACRHPGGARHDFADFAAKEVEDRAPR